MPEKNPAVGELSALKARHEGTGRQPRTAGQTPESDGGGVLPRSIWLGLAVVLALGAAVSLTLSYRELRRLAERDRALQLKEQRLAEYDQRLADLSAGVAKMDARAEQLKAELRLLEGDAAKGAEAAAAYKTFAVMVPNLKKEAEDLSARIEALRGEKSGLDGAVAKVQATLDVVQSAKTNTQANLDLIERNVAYRRGDITELLSAISSNKVALAAYNQAVQEQKTEYATLKRDCEAKRKERDDQVRERDEARAAMSGLQDAVTRLKSERTTATNELAEMTIEIARLSSRISAERKSLADMDGEKIRLTGELTRLATTKSEYDALAQKKDEVGRQFASLTQQTEGQKALLAGKTAELVDLKKQVDALEAKRLDLERAVNQLIGQQTVLETKSAAGTRK
jgi:chromosome segregation protein